MSNIFDLSNFITSFSESFNVETYIFNYILAIFWIALVIIMINCLSCCFVFRKANKPFWAAFVPIYNNYVECEVCGVNTVWVWINLILSLVLGGIPLLSIVSLIASIYFRVIIAISMAKSFGKDSSFGFFIFLFKTISYLILGCGSSEYIGPQPVQDHILEVFGVEQVKDNLDYNNDNNNLHSDNNVKYCSSCGNPVNLTENYCACCGNKI